MPWLRVAMPSRQLILIKNNKMNIGTDAWNDKLISRIFMTILNEKIDCLDLKVFAWEKRRRLQFIQIMEQN